jgi:6-phosphogluconolactonase (cycloisomerase 2 family)
MRSRFVLTLCGLGLLAGCDKDVKLPPPPPAPTYTVGGNISGLNGSVTLANNAGDARTVSASGAFTFTTALANGAAYNVSITSQPVNQTCAVTGGTGTIAAANVSAIIVTCTTNTFSVGGTVTGLSGSVTLANNGGDNLARSADGAFTFATPVNTGSAYNVTVATQPADQTCAVANGSGTIAANVTAITVTCTTYRVTATIGSGGGTLTHPSGAQVVIPAGALTQDTVIGIATPASGWPTPFAQDATPLGPVYEFTPHNTVFAKPVTIRLPKLPTSMDSLGAMVSSFGEEWEIAPSLTTTNYVEYERNTFSWYYEWGYACINAPAGGCGGFRGGSSFPTATPASAILMTSGGNSLHPSSGMTTSSGSAGTWDVDSDAIQSLSLTLEWYVPSACGPEHVILKRFDPGVPTSMTVIHDIGGAGSGARGSITLPVPLNMLEPGLNTFRYSAACAKPGEAEMGGGDWITFNLRPGPVGGFRVGGTITGLSMTGLELQNAFREFFLVPPNASSFTFPTPQKDASHFEVRVHQQPTGGVCTVTNNTGDIAGADVTNVSVSCTPTQSSVVGYAVVANENTGSANLFGRNSSNFLALDDTKTTGSTPESVVVSPNGLFAYVGNRVQGSISSFSIDNATNKLVPIPLGSPGTQNPSALAMDVDGRILLATNYNTSTGGGALSLFSIDATSGAPTPVATVATGRSPAAVAIDPQSRFVYTANEGTSDISMFSLDRSVPSLTSNGALSNAVSSATAIVVDPTGKFVYALSNFGNITRLSINQTTGNLTRLGFTAVNGGTSCTSMATLADGDILYVTCASSTGSTLNAYSIGSDGSLTAGPVTILPTTSVAKVAIGGSGLVMHVAMKAINQVAVYSINQSTGELTLRSSIASPGGPSAIAVTR